MPQRVHGLADDVLAQHRPERGQPVTAPRERRPPGTLEMEIVHPAGGVDELAEQQRAAVTEPGDEPAELVTCVGLRSGRRIVGDDRSHQ